MKGPIRTLAAAASSTTAVARGLAMATFVIGLTACSTGSSVDDVLSMRPSVGVGDQTSGIYRADEPQTFQETGPGRFQQDEEPVRRSREPSYNNRAAEPDYGAQDTETDYGSSQPAEPAYGGESSERVMGEPEQTLDSRRQRLDEGQDYEQPPARTTTRQPKVRATEPQHDEYDYFGRKVGTPGSGPAYDGQGAASEETNETSQSDEMLQPAADVEQTTEETYDTGYPRLSQPVEEPRNVLSADEVSCRRDLKKLGVNYQDLAPIRDGKSCFIDHPVKVSAMGSVQMKPAATLTCRMALTFAQWTKNELVPSARWRYFSGVKTIRQGSSYSCRKIAGSRTQSSHSQGNALDVMAIELNNGKSIDVRKQGLFAFRARKLLNNVRADGCEYFTTVLGPGYNYDHRNHFHFDLMQRKNGRRSCR